MSGGPLPAGPSAVEVDAALQRALFAAVVLRVKAVAGQWAAEQEVALTQLPPAVAVDLLVEVAVGYLVGSGLVTVAPGDAPARRPGEWRDRVPELLRPDAGRVLGGYERLWAELERGEDPPGT